LKAAKRRPANAPVVTSVLMKEAALLEVVAAGAALDAAEVVAELTMVEEGAADELAAAELVVAAAAVSAVALRLPHFSLAVHCA